MSFDLLPDLAAHKIVQRLAGQGIFQLLALASLSRQWRSVVRACQLDELRLESKTNFQQRNTFQGDALATPYFQLTNEKKTQLLIAAARLLRQHNAVHCAGDAINDIVLLEVAKGSADSFCIEVRALSYAISLKINVSAT